MPGLAIHCTSVANRETERSDHPEMLDIAEPVTRHWPRLFGGDAARPNHSRWQEYRQYGRWQYRRNQEGYCCADCVAKRLAQELIVNDKVHILGVGITPVAMAIAPLATEAKIPEVVMYRAPRS